MAEQRSIIVRRPSGSWRWQEAYALSTYERETPAHPWRFVGRTNKFAKTRATAHYWDIYGIGIASLPAREGQPATGKRR